MDKPLNPQALVKQAVLEYQLKYALTEKQAHTELRRELRHLKLE